jgi:beta-N-acetylhexosaminidase
MKLIILFFLNFPLFLSGNLSKLTLEEKIGQLLMVHFYGESENEEARKLIQDIKVGGIIYFNWSNGLTSRSQIKTLSHHLQELTYDNPHPIPLLIATDQEGGKVSRLNSTCFTKHPGNRSLGELFDFKKTKELAFQIGKEMKCVGIHLNLSPVVDIATHENSPLIERSFGNHPEKVTALGKATLEGYREAHLLTTLKHFPGHGSVDVDSHRDLPYCLKTLEELETFELIPFKELHFLTDAIMTGHILVEALDSENCATLSQKTLTNYLRETLGFEGVIISDSLVMQGVLKTCKTVEEAAIRAINAGCDILLLGGAELIEGDIHFELTVPDIKRVHNALVLAVKEGRILEERLDDAVSRILLLKDRMF